MALPAASLLETPRRSGAARLRPGAAQPPAGSAAGQGRVTAALPAARRGRAPPPGSGAPRARAAGPGSRSRVTALCASPRRGVCETSVLRAGCSSCEGVAEKPFSSRKVAALSAQSAATGELLGPQAAVWQVQHGNKKEYGQRLLCASSISLNRNSIP